MLRPTGTISPVTRSASGQAIAEMRVWKEKEFEDSEARWQELLGRSVADPLFMSWSWQWTWWHHHAALLKSSLYLLAAYSGEGELVALAPLHLRRAAHRRPLSAMRLEIIGSTWRHSTGAYSEYLDFIVDPRYEDVFMEALADVVLNDHGWSDLIIANSKRSSVAARFVRKYLRDTCYIREVDPLIAQLAPLPSSFTQYAQTLHSGVRRKVWNQRARVPSVQFVHVEPDRIDSMFNAMNDFHERRWGSRQFLGSFRDFHLDFARRCAERGNLQMSVLSVGGDLISVMYNVRVGATVYNIQSGFSSTVVGISPGYLHFGFCLEAACSEGIKGFDFLAGDGRNRDYKRDFVTQGTELVTLQCIRARPLAWLYKEYDRRTPTSVASFVAFPASVFDTTCAETLGKIARLIG
ncbi:MAG TPA: GNAT family N-acetyltransferase [Steroidobacteraceae bacterium]|jgi:CelD/BcsL family acetyltransferase involved in cellulose biosynthesis